MSKPRIISLLIALSLLAGALAPAVRAAAAPGAITGSAQNVNDTSATLAGTVNPNGQATQYVFEYGTTANYGFQTVPGTAGSGSSSVGEAAGLANLAPATTYHYRIVADNPGGTSLGIDRTFTTSALPTPVTGSASGISSS